MLNSVEDKSISKYLRYFGGAVVPFEDLHSQARFMVFMASGPPVQLEPVDLSVKAQAQAAAAAAAAAAAVVLQVPRYSPQLPPSHAGKPSPPPATCRPPRAATLST
ncbi:Uncharacterized protein GBIM_10047 [Gryllus bimaculatus]|nr:Uncharacterized protein GBIM_10047 [Gryllus bimaculatus]